MSAGTIIVIVVVLVLLAVAAAVVSMRISRGTTERTVHGAEYDRLADEIGPRKAQAEFAKRRQRVDGLGIKSLSDERRAAYTGQWDVAQEQFVDNPAQSVRAAAAMIAAVTADRGYEVTDHEQLLTDLSVYHGRYLDGYRQARTTAAPGRPGQHRGTAAGADQLPGPLLRPARTGRRRRAGSWPDSAGARAGDGQGARPAAVAAGHPGAAPEDQAPGRRRQPATSTRP